MPPRKSILSATPAKAAATPAKAAATPAKRAAAPAPAEDESDEFFDEDGPRGRTVLLVAILAVAALVVAGAALALTLLRPAATASTDACRALSWASLPDSSTLPAGWILAGSGFYSDGYSTSVVGPAASGATDVPSIYVRLNCLGSDDHLALTRSHDAAVAAGSSTVAFASLGVESFALQDPTGGTTVYFRRSGIVAYLVASATVTPADLQQAATAFDLAIAAATASSGSGIVGNTAPTAPIGTLAPGASGLIAGSSPLASVGPSATPSHSVPALEAILPQAVNGTAFSTQSLTGTDALGTDAASVALAASIKGFGKTPADFQVAESYDDSGTVAVTILAFRVVGVDGVPVRQAILASWLAAAGSGMTTAPATVAGKAVIKVDYGDGGPLDYVYVHGEDVLDVSTADTALAATVLALLP
ncbi:MAG: hypothetical protein ACRDGQ_03310 [Candidatus Limnocylindrales bacterium]